MTPSRAICAGGSRVMSLPLYRIAPDVGSRNFVSRLKQVVLPAPLGPISAWMLPRRTFRFTSLTAVKPLNSFVSPRASRMVDGDVVMSSLQQLSGTADDGHLDEARADAVLLR